MGTHDMRSRTVGGLLAFADYLGEKGYQGKNAIQAWKTAIAKVFETTGGDDWEDVSLDGIDLDDLARRFHTLTGNTYKAESVTVYRRRIQNAMEAQAYFIENDRPPTFKKQPKKDRAEKKDEATPAATTTDAPTNTPVKTTEPELFEVAFPLAPGRTAYFRLPPSLSRREIEKLSTLLSTLEEQPQLPERSAA